MSFQKLRSNLLRAIHSKDFETVQKIVDENSKLLLNYSKLRNNNLNRLLESLLIFSINCKNSKVCGLLIVDFIEKFFKFKVKFTNLDQQLKFAVKNGNVRVSELLLKNEAKLTGEVWNDLNLVASLIFNRENLDSRKEMLELLLNNGLNFRLINDKAQNILHKFIDDFVKENDADAGAIGKILVDRGISMHETDRRGWKAIHYCVKKNKQLFEFFLIEKKNLSEEDNILMAELFVDRISPEINSIVRDGCTILHGLCLSSYETGIWVALRRGANVNLLNNDNKTPFGCLRPDPVYYDACVETMVKEFAKLNYEKRSVSQINMELVESNEKAKEFYKKCTNELKFMSIRKFYKQYNLYFFLRMSNKRKLVNLMRNKDFVAKFKDNLDFFTCYKKDLKIIFREAIEHKDSVLLIEFNLSKIFNNYLPAIVIRKLAENLNDN